MELEAAKQQLREGWEKGLDCPCCGQHVQKYRYPLFATSAVALLLLYRLTKQAGKEFFHVREFAEQGERKIRSPHFAELRFWGLIEPMDKKTASENSSGMWSITPKGCAFCEERLSVPKYVHIYNNKLVRIDGEEVTISQCLGNKFDYNEIMNGCA